MITLEQFIDRFPSKAAAARQLGWSPNHLQDRLRAKKQIWVCTESKKWFIEGGGFS